MSNLTLNIPSLSCSSCSNKITSGIQTLEGIKDVNVDLKTQQVSINYDPSNLDPRKIQNKITSLGFESIM